MNTDCPHRTAATTPTGGGGPPGDTATAVIAVGLDHDQLTRYFADVEPVGRIDNGLGIDNDEQGRPLFVCREPRVPWSELWPQAEHLG
ncbi:hypothetical protein [Nocardia sp. CA-119907]|uniref:hypothetical protein n=1 Tax=Nocardia sp. CA-119907 TaxID=3239973 RepID=UPI003D96EA8C